MANPKWAAEIQKNEIIKQKNPIASGQFGSVYRGHCRGTDVAIKEPKYQLLDLFQVAAFKKEINIMKENPHPNVCLFMGAVVDKDNIMMVTELMECDVHAELYKPNSSTTILQRLKWAKDAAQGLAWLHGNKPTIIHRDLKPNNLLLDAYGTVKVTDFGLSDFLFIKDEKLRDVRPKGLLYYMAPEVFAKENITPKVDVYSFGIVLWELVTKTQPFRNHSDYDEFSKAIINGERPPVGGLHPSLVSFLQRCWSKDPDVRPPFTDILRILDDLMLDLSIKDPVAKEFWKQQFPGQTKVNWKTFINSLYQELKGVQPFPALGKFELPNKVTDNELSRSSPAQKKEYAARSPDNFRSVFALNEYSCLDDNDFFLAALRLLFIGNHNSNQVTLEEFVNLISLFGPFGPEMLVKLRDLVDQQWFHGNISRDEAESKLQNMPVGTFLVRVSASSPDHFVIASVSASKISQRLLLHTPGVGFTLNDEVFPDLKELLCVSEKRLNLTNPCPGSKFQQLRTVINPYE